MGFIENNGMKKLLPWTETIGAVEMLASAADLRRCKTRDNAIVLFSARTACRYGLLNSALNDVSQCIRRCHDKADSLRDVLHDHSHK